MKVKKWIISGDNQEEVEVSNLRDSLTLESYRAQEEVPFKFSVRYNLSPLRKKSLALPDLLKEGAW